MPCQYEGFSIQTWVENVYRLFTDRNFAILDKEGKAVGYARSVWAMISMELANQLTCLRFTEVVSLIMYAIRNVL